LVAVVVLGGCALITGADDLKTGTEEEQTPDASSPNGLRSDASVSTPPSIGDIPIPPFFDGGSNPAVLDSGVLPDGGAIDPRAGVSCGNVTCIPGAHCCITPPLSNVCSGNCMAGYGDVACDNSYDCGSGKVCCAESAGGVISFARCATSCAGAGTDTVQLCADGDCKPGDSCVALSSPFGSKYRYCQD